MLRLRLRRELQLRYNFLGSYRKGPKKVTRKIENQIVKEFADISLVETTSLMWGGLNPNEIKDRVLH